MSRLAGFVDAARRRVASGYYVVDEPAPAPHGSLCQALARPDAVIAELKPASPSQGILLQGATQPVLDDYVAGGAAALSVLTDADHFGGRIAWLRQAHGTGLPTMMKDFVIDPVQIDAAAKCGASAVLLIERILEPAQREALVAAAHEAGLEVLLEVFGDADLATALQSDADLIGVNARDLETLDVDPERQARLIQEAHADGRPVVALSGITSRRDRLAMQAQGAAAVLVGTSLMRHPDRSLALKAMRRPLVKVCGITHPDDVDAASAAGADLLGFVVGSPDSPRDLSPDTARRLMGYARMRGVHPVMVTGMDDPETLMLWATACRPAYVQAPADQDVAARLAAAGIPYLAVTTPGAPTQLGDGFVIDTPHPAGGGSGKTHDWSATAQLCDARPDDVSLVAGGLAADNAADAVADSHAWGVDASSRLESAPGRKDPDAVTAFVAAAHGPKAP